MVQCKTAVTPWLMHWHYQSLALSLWSYLAVLPPLRDILYWKDGVFILKQNPQHVGTSQGRVSLMCCQRWHNGPCCMGCTFSVSAFRHSVHSSETHPHIRMTSADRVWHYPFYIILYTKISVLKKAWLYEHGQHVKIVSCFYIQHNICRNHWKSRVVRMPALSPLVLLEVVIMIGSASDDKVGIMTTVGFSVFHLCPFLGEEMAIMFRGWF